MIVICPPLARTPRRCGARRRRTSCAPTMSRKSAAPGRAGRGVEQALERRPDVLRRQARPVCEMQAREQLDAERAAPARDDRQVAREAGDDHRAGQPFGVGVAHERRAEGVGHRARLAGGRKGRIEGRQRLRGDRAQDARGRTRRGHRRGRRGGAVVAPAEARTAAAREQGHGQERQHGARNARAPAAPRRSGALGSWHGRSLDDRGGAPAAARTGGRSRSARTRWVVGSLVQVLGWGLPTSHECAYPHGVSAEHLSATADVPRVRVAGGRMRLAMIGAVFVFRSWRSLSH